MIDIPFTQVDAFVVDGKPLTGNPAAVMILDDWLDNATLQAIAIENNLSETAFLVKADGEEADWKLRWFTPGGEVKMCGHATIAAGHTVKRPQQCVRFSTLSGILSVQAGSSGLILDLPGSRETKVVDNRAIIRALGADPLQQLYAETGEGAYIAVYENEDQIRSIQPDYRLLKTYSELIVITAPGRKSDIASRVFAPHYNLDEDPVTGAAHAAIAPWWARRLGKTTFSACQASARGGQLNVDVVGDRVRLTGSCLTVIEGRFRLA